MKISGLHILLTYRCERECDHCFVWGSPWQEGTLTLMGIEQILAQARDLATLEWIYFEGGEPFLYYPVLTRGVHLAAASGFSVGIVSNAYWATTVDDAVEWLTPFRGVVQDLTISSDLYHSEKERNALASNAAAAAERLEIPVQYLSVGQPEDTGADAKKEHPPSDECGLMFRGRATEELIGKVGRQPWGTFDECPHEELRDPDRVHLDPLGHVHVCQGISVGNVFRATLREICEGYDPDAHPVVGPLLRGGPAELVREYGLPHAPGYADACHLCDEARRSLRSRFPNALTPDQMYGVVGDIER